MLSTVNDIAPEDFIYCNSWGRLVKDLNRPNLLYCQNENIATILKNNDISLFNKYRDEQNQLTELPRSYILLSGYSDYGICEQAIDHPNKDLVKTANSINYEELAGHSQYITINLQTVAPGCNQNDKYSVKIDRYTKDTFNAVPAQAAKLFTSNCNIAHDRVAWVPFGLGVADFQDKVGPARDLILANRERPKKELIYMRFANHTYQRSLLNKHYQGSPDSVDQPRYFRELAGSKFSLCPFGNGLDSYRIWECLYCGVIPVIQDSAFSRNLAEAGLPVHVMPNLFELTETYLLKVYSEMKDKDYNLNSLRLSSWRERIQNELIRLAKLENPDGGCLHR